MHYCLAPGGLRVVLLMTAVLMLAIGAVLLGWLLALEQAYPQAAPFTFDNTRIIAVGISNGGGAVLRAAELVEEGLE